MKNKGYKYIFLATLLTILMLIPSVAVKANTSKNIKVDAFIKLLVDSLELKVDKTVDQPYIDTALKYGREN